MGDFIQLGLGRWLHILAGVMWIGLLYYFNFVQVPALAEAAKDQTGAGITKHVAPRALLYFRWAAVVTWLAGAMILGAHFLDAFLFSQSLRRGTTPALSSTAVNSWPLPADGASAARIGPAPPNVCRGFTRIPGG